MMTLRNTTRVLTITSLARVIGIQWTPTLIQTITTRSVPWRVELYIKPIFLVFDRSLTMQLKIGSFGGLNVRPLGGLNVRPFSLDNVNQSFGWTISLFGRSCMVNKHSRTRSYC